VGDTSAQLGRTGETPIPPLEFLDIFLFGSPLALPIATNYVLEKRGAVTSKILSMPCDILLYQARGGRIRDFIQQKIEQVEPPVVLLAHSLGGIACVDLLVLIAT
jgi:hypothetical protein